MEAIFSVFNFINSILSTIIKGIRGTIDIINSVINLLISITRIIPNPLYGAFIVFITLYGIIFTYKIFRQG